jgi:hypothetical protein
MITGFNTNVRHGGRVFHVQTEDSGIKNPHVISHLYFGGTILSSEKQTYDQLLEQEGDLTSAIRSLMEEQHRRMLEGLKRGDFDAVITDRLGTPEDDVGREPAAAAAGPAEVRSAAAAGPAEARSAPAVKSAEAGSAAAGDAEGYEFGDGIVSDKPLDEVILEYLVEKARTRPGDTRPGRGNRSRE